ncbi:MAG: hypothetical protein M0Q91_14760 [Methanoregula sp.]|jgi:hypothetical protein|nr:hypothetical protein [Methanoregula sp.]
MNVTIAGSGIAGGYLARLLERKGINVDIYDGMDHDTRCRCRSCGWGAPTGIKTYLADVGLDFNDYLIEPMSPMNFDGLMAKTPLCTLNKPRLIKDLARGTGLKQQNLEPEGADSYNIVVDAPASPGLSCPPAGPI